ncbi:hypothetical protein [Streptomyces sp. NRRL B-24484]|uniref:hypothetical protein n=1 Tax=Streptomyces sp. NRRL B-24484 TaxID=1463833 RepID=UPI0004C20648|nr:hypothetical protein [Streptomyces sp. NRRL B-24484]
METEFTYDIRYRLDPSAEVRTRRLTLADPDPQPGYGPALGHLHQALRRSDPVEFGDMTDPAQLAILSVRQVVEA